MSSIDEIDYEDTLLHGFESTGLRRDNQALRRKLADMEERLLAAQHRSSGVKGIRELRERADRFERLYRVTLARCEILARKLREAGSP